MLHENYLRYFDQYQNLKRGITDLVDMTRSILYASNFTQICCIMTYSFDASIDLSYRVN